MRLGFIFPLKSVTAEKQLTKKQKITEEGKIAQEQTVSIQADIMEMTESFRSKVQTKQKGETPHLCWGAVWECAVQGEWRTAGVTRRRGGLLSEFPTLHGWRRRPGLKKAA